MKMRLVYKKKFPVILKIKIDDATEKLLVNPFREQNETPATVETLVETYNKTRKTANETQSSIELGEHGGSERASRLE